MRPDTFVVRPATIHVHFEPPVSPAGRSVDATMEAVRDAFVRRLAATESLPPLEAPATPDAG